MECCLCKREYQSQDRCCISIQLTEAYEKVFWKKWTSSVNISEPSDPSDVQSVNRSQLSITRLSGCVLLGLCLNDSCMVRMELLHVWYTGKHFFLDNLRMYFNNFEERPAYFIYKQGVSREGITGEYYILVFCCYESVFQVVKIPIKKFSKVKSTPLKMKLGFPFKSH